MSGTSSTSQVQHAEFQRQLAHCRNPDPYMCVIAGQCARWSATGNHVECAPYIEPWNGRGCRTFKVHVLAKPDGDRTRTLGV